LAFRRNFNPGVAVTWLPRIWHPKSSPRRDWCCFSAQQMPHKAKSILCVGKTGMVRSCTCVEKRHDAARNRASTPPQARVTPSVLCANSEREEETEGEEGGGSRNPRRRRGASVQLHPHLGPAAPVSVPSAATNPVRLHLDPGARRLVPLLLCPPLRLLILPIFSQCTYLFLSPPLLYCLCLVSLDMDILCSAVLPAVAGRMQIALAALR